MPHFDQDRLALIALGEEGVDAEENEHLTTCPICAADLEDLTHTAAVGRATIDNTLETPPERVWHRITDELALSAGAPIVELAPRRRADVRGRTGRRPWAWVVAAAAAVALIAVIGAGVSVFVRPAVTQLASATLDALPDHAGAVGAAAVDERPDGSRVLTLSLDSAATPGYREVWLMTPDASRLISLGLLDGDSGDFAIPQSVDLAQYEVVDVSVEPLDGVPAHSGDSIVRGQLQFG